MAALNLASCACSYCQLYIHAESAVTIEMNDQTVAVSHASSERMTAVIAVQWLHVTVLYLLSQQVVVSTGL